MPRKRKLAYIASEIAAQQSPVHPLDKIVRAMERRSSSPAKKPRRKGGK
ncbi:hypothetical protein [Clostridium sp. D33t1_170424_F3]|nr:hypothetical protein [Clostridium sp. D33t1_170424_F3]MDC0700519.1 hypothetical protein [Blautia wexlerae]